MVHRFDPYLEWLGITPDRQPPNHYDLLGIELYESDQAAIQSAGDERMTHVRRHSTGRHSARTQPILNELAAAKLCLLDPDKKAAYDAVLRDGPTPPPPPSSPVPPPGPPTAIPVAEPVGQEVSEKEVSEKDTHSVPQINRRLASARVRPGRRRPSVWPFFLIALAIAIATIAWLMHR